MQIVSHSRMFFLLLLFHFLALHGVSCDWLLTRTMLLFFSACPVIVWMVFLERKEKMRVQCWMCAIIVAYTIISIQERERKYCIIMIFGLAVHLKSVHILPVWMRLKFRCTTTHKNSRRTYIFQTDFKLISQRTHKHTHGHILQCSTVYWHGWYSKRNWTSESDRRVADLCGKITIHPSTISNIYDKQTDKVTEFSLVSKSKHSHSTHGGKATMNSTLVRTFEMYTIGTLGHWVWLLFAFAFTWK